MAAQTYPTTPLHLVSLKPTKQHPQEHDQNEKYKSFVLANCFKIKMASVVKHLGMKQICILFILTEAALQRCSYKNVFLKYAANL